MHSSDSKSRSRYPASWTVRCPAMGRDFSQHRRALATRVRRTHWTERHLHHSRSRGFGRFARHGAARAWLGRDEESLSNQGKLSRSLFPHGKQWRAVERCAQEYVPPVHPVGSRTEKAL